MILSDVEACGCDPICGLLVCDALAAWQCRSFLILRIAIKQVREGVTKDVREED